MEGLEVSEILLSVVKKESYSYRWDSSYFLKEFINSPLENMQTDLIENLFEIKSGTTPRDRDSNLNEGVILLKTNDIRNNVLKNKRDSFFYIDEDTNSKMKATQLMPNDVLINIVGATTDVIGRVSFISESFPKANITQAMSLMRAKQERVMPQFLFCFLLSKYGNMQVRRFARPTGQYNMNHSELGCFEIPLFSIDFQNDITSIISINNILEIKSQTLYAQAENLLLQEIDLQNFTPNAEAVNIKSFKESFGTSGRLDAEYYQPKYEALISKIKNYKNGFYEFDYFIDNFSTGFAYKSETYLDKDGVPLIRINNIGKGILDLSNSVRIPLNDLNLSSKDIANENDVLISMSGTIGNSCKVPKNVKAVVNQRIMRVTPKNINTDVLPILINSIIGQYQLERIGTGGVQTNISGNDIKSILIPNIEKEKQEQIAQLVAESFRLKQESENLLEVAKRAVEIAIEQNEESAMKFIEQNS